jgi:hypothetical protein
MLVYLTSPFIQFCLYFAICNINEQRSLQDLFSQMYKNTCIPQNKGGQCLSIQIDSMISVSTVINK